MCIDLPEDLPNSLTQNFIDKRRIKMICMQYELLIIIKQIKLAIDLIKILKYFIIIILKLKIKKEEKTTTTKVINENINREHLVQR